MAVKNWEDISIALAGLFQAVGLVEQIAKTGYLPSDAYRCSIESLFVFEPRNARQVYGNNLGSMTLGLELLQAVLEPGNQRHREALSYALGILHLHRKLGGRKDMLGVLGSRLQQAARQAEHFSSTHENVIGNLGDTYQETLSRFRFRIQVSGDQQYLQQKRITHQVRALLLAGIRAASLWRQSGGSRWQLLFQRKRLAASVDALLREAKASQV